MSATFVEVSRISFLGWNFGPNQGQFDADEASVKAHYYRFDMSITPSVLHWQRDYNDSARFPVLSTWSGICKIWRAFSEKREELFVERKDEFSCRVLLFCVGLLEITYIGGLIVHGIASIYFAWTRNGNEAGGDWGTELSCRLIFNMMC